MHIYKVIFFCLLISTPCFSQTGNTTLIKKKYDNISPHQTIDISINQSFAGVSIKANLPNFDGAYLVSKKDTFKLKPFQDQKPEDDFVISNPIFFQDTISHFTLSTGSLKDSIEIHFYLPLPKISSPSARRISSSLNCEEPYSIPSSIWRTGLPAPTVKPVCTEVEHVIIHHSAIDNANYSYLDQIRFIYTFHTQSNGWDDIGYNFLVAADGTIFDGRDAQGVCEKDNIKGAHLCAKNNNTMGICLMGNYNAEVPSAPMLSSLYRLISWKLYKETLDPYGVLTFPKGTMSQLPVIAGHRDGCDTECPGEKVYALMNNFRDSVFARESTCNITSTTVAELSHPKLSQTPEGDLLINTKHQITKGYFTDMQGRQITPTKPMKNIIQTSMLPSGIYILRLQIDDSFYTYKYLKQ